MHPNGDEQKYANDGCIWDKPVDWLLLVVIVGTEVCEGTDTGTGNSDRVTGVMADTCCLG
jgi:hypothetical protein